MRLEMLVDGLRRLEPTAEDVAVARLALVLLQQHDRSRDPEPDLAEACRGAKARVASLQDQRMAAFREIESIAADAACEFKPEQVFALARGFRLQHQLLELLGS